MEPKTSLVRGPVRACARACTLALLVVVAALAGAAAAPASAHAATIGTVDDWSEVEQASTLNLYTAVLGEPDAGDVSTTGNLVWFDSDDVEGRSFNVDNLVAGLFFYKSAQESAANGTSVSGTATITWEDVGIDADGDAVDLTISVSAVKYLTTDTTASRSGYQSVFIVRDEGYVAADKTVFTSSGTPTSGISATYKISFTKSDDGTAANGAFFAFFRDLDQAVEESTAYSEGVKLGSGFSSTAYVKTTNYLKISGSRAYADGDHTTDVDDEEAWLLGLYESSSSNSSATFTWTGGGGTTLFEVFSSTIKLTVTGTGGTVVDEALAGTDADDTAYTYATAAGGVELLTWWRNDRVFDIAVNVGYKIKQVKVNGATKSSYTGLGAGDTIDPVTFSEVVEDGSLTVQFTPITYTIKFNKNGGSGSMSSMSCTYASYSKLTANSFTRTGYTFAGWNTASGGTGTSYSDQQSVKNLTTVDGATVTLYAQWQPISYTIAFDGNGGSGSMSSMDCDYGTAYTLSANAFTRAGYLFAGWNTAADGSGTSYEDEASVKSLTTTDGATITLYAQWEAQTYSIAYDANGGSGTMATQTGLKFGNDYTLSANSFTAPEQTSEDGIYGYLFDGWNTAADGSGDSYSDEATVRDLASDSGETVTLYAQWLWGDLGGWYQMRFYGRGGTLSDGTSGPVVYTWFYYKTYEAPGAIYEVEGYTQTGWYCPDGAGPDSLGGNVYLPDTYMTDTTAGNDFNCYAVWTANTYTVAFDANADDATGEMDPLSCTYNKDATLAENAFARTGYTFAGWNTAADGSGTSYADGEQVKNLSSVDGDVVTLYAQWQPIGYTIVFDGNADDATGEMDPLSCTYDEGVYLTANEFERTGYAFAGWSTADDGSGASYVDQQLAKNLTSVDGATVTLYAQWQPIEYTVTFDKNGGKGDMDDQTLAYDTAEALSANSFTRTGYTFAGWNTAADGSGTSYEDEEVVTNLSSVADDVVTLYAQWSPISYTVSFDPSPGTGGPDPIDVVYDDPATVPDDEPTRPGYVFGGWTVEGDDPDDGDPVYQPGDVLPNLTPDDGDEVVLVATWTPITYTVAFDANGGTGEMDDMTCTYDEEASLTPCAFTRTGWSFTGWNDAADGTGASYADEESVVNLTTTDGATITLYAQWEAQISVTVPTLVACVVMPDGSVVAPSGYGIANNSEIAVRTTVDGVEASFVEDGTTTRLATSDNDVEVFNTDEGALASFSIATGATRALVWSIDDLDATANAALLAAAASGAIEVCSVTFIFEAAE